MELLVSTRKGRPESRSRLRHASAPGMGTPSWMSTPSMSVSHDSMGLRSDTAATPSLPVLGPPAYRAPAPPPGQRRLRRPRAAHGPPSHSPYNKAHPDGPL